MIFRIAAADACHVVAEYALGQQVLEECRQQPAVLRRMAAVERFAAHVGPKGGLIGGRVGKISRRYDRSIGEACESIVGHKPGNNLGPRHAVLEQDTHAQGADKNGERLDVHLVAPRAWRRATSMRVATLGFTVAPASTAAAAPLGTKIISSPRRSASASKVLRSEEHTSELQSLMRISYAVFC